MTATISKAQAIRVLEREHRRVAELVDGVPEEYLERPRTIGDGEWSTRDLLGHLTFWMRNALDALDAWERNAPAPIDQAFRTSSLTQINERAVLERRRRSYREIRAEFDAVQEELIARIRRTPPTRWNAPPTSRARRALGDALGRILVGRGAFAHASAHLPDLERFVRST